MVIILICFFLLKFRFFCFCLVNGYSVIIYCFCINVGFFGGGGGGGCFFIINFLLIIIFFIVGFGEIDCLWVGFE